ncbi:hypothetical protein ZOSMA_59G00020 [Zostera marina]|uniref:Uncharacterized protein n=1 Tax=Zostera marina TaxID=29655 RepID=A0A0K9NWM6_ZOSMR|nr:hypothetical protein ZOSMA_59G00020 [Zostera marina]
MIFRDNKVGWLLNILSSSLKLSLQAFQEAFIYVFNDIQSCSHDFSPVLLLKHTIFDKSKHDVLLEKCNSKSSKLESVFCLLSKLDGLLKKRNNGYPIPLILDSLLHGFPLFPEISSAILVSCALNVQAIVSVNTLVF